MPTAKEITSEREAELKLRWKNERVNFFTSDRHRMGGFREADENLDEMGMHQYLQEYMCDFVEPADMVFSYDDIESMFNSPTISTMEFHDISKGEVDDRFDILEMLK